MTRVDMMYPKLILTGDEAWTGKSTLDPHFVILEQTRDLLTTVKIDTANRGLEEIVDEMLGVFVILSDLVLAQEQGLCQTPVRGRQPAGRRSHDHARH